MTSRKIRSDLFLQIAFGVVTAILLFSWAIYQFIILPSSAHLANTEMRLAANTVQLAVESFFADTEKQLLLVRDIAQQDNINPEDASSTKRLFLPVMQRNPQISSIMLANENAQELIIFKDTNGWRTRITNPQDHRGKAHWLYWNKAVAFQTE
ncbi:MAG: hypothetical protein E6713_05650 [Sporomusaceae bacterium]|nr:hypothetical protein [Sporomusaceae bacterium]